jgi:hypothetical protein
MLQIIAFLHGSIALIVLESNSLNPSSLIRLRESQIRLKRDSLKPQVPLSPPKYLAYEFTALLLYSDLGHYSQTETAYTKSPRSYANTK